MAALRTLLHTVLIVRELLLLTIKAVMIILEILVAGVMEYALMLQLRNLILVTLETYMYQVLKSDWLCPNSIPLL